MTRTCLILRFNKHRHSYVYHIQGGSGREVGGTRRKRLWCTSRNLELGCVATRARQRLGCLQVFFVFTDETPPTLFDNHICEP